MNHYNQKESKFNEKLGNWNPKIIEFNSNENWQYLDSYVWNLVGGEGLGHSAVSITFCGKTFYFDDGWWGYVFRPGDIPFYTFPLPKK